MYFVMQGNGAEIKLILTRQMVFFFVVKKTSFYLYVPAAFFTAYIMHVQVELY